ESSMHERRKKARGLEGVERREFKRVIKVIQLNVGNKPREIMKLIAQAVSKPPNVVISIVKLTKHHVLSSISASESRSIEVVSGPTDIRSLRTHTLLPFSVTWHRSIVQVR
ncbi:MAG: hypothetical protein ACOVQH_06135, partial [Burkholderiaceae bacterium]